ncbi:MAG TPA: glycine zipper 2TM domain-containing protein [Chitinophagales bacterium]|nr:glycine zipper 2TM domain-containing protein [Chitinophagales bacterium]
MHVELIDDTPVLVPNKEHQNFTRTATILPKGLLLEGEPITVSGKRRGEPFDYKLFYTKDYKFIHIKKTNPVKNISNTREVYLGADNKQSATVVDLPSRNLFTTYTVVGAVAGAAIGNYIAKKRGGNKNYYMLAGAVAGFFAGRYAQGNRNIFVKKSK